jgi:hypothetical protein
MEVAEVAVLGKQEKMFQTELQPVQQVEQVGWEHLNTLLGAL